jgi:hypothetical protein
VTTAWTSCTGSSRRRSATWRRAACWSARSAATARALERAYPKLEFAWPEVSDPGTVFILQREQLPGYVADRDIIRPYLPGRSQNGLPASKRFQAGSERR